MEKQGPKENQTGGTNKQTPPAPFKGFHGKKKEGPGEAWEIFRLGPSKRGGKELAWTEEKAIRLIKK